MRECASAYTRTHAHISTTFSPHKDSPNHTYTHTNTRTYTNAHSAYIHHQHQAPKHADQIQATNAQTAPPRQAVMRSRLSTTAGQRRPPLLRPACRPWTAAIRSASWLPQILRRHPARGAVLSEGLRLSGKDVYMLFIIFGELYMLFFLYQWLCSHSYMQRKSYPARNVYACVCNHTTSHFLLTVTIPLQDLL